MCLINIGLQQEVLGSRSPPLDSSGSSVNSESTNSGQEDKPSSDETDNDGGDSHDLVTCYCGKPFAGRPMIECTSCLIWIHLSCARIRKTHIPEVFYCAVCKGQQQQQSPPSSPSASLKRLKRAPLSPV